MIPRAASKVVNDPIRVVVIDTSAVMASVFSGVITNIATERAVMHIIRRNASIRITTAKTRCPCCCSETSFPKADRFNSFVQRIGGE